MLGKELARNSVMLIPTGGSSIQQTQSPASGFGSCMSSRFLNFKSHLPAKTFRIFRSSRVQDVRVTRKNISGVLAFQVW